MQITNQEQIDNVILRYGKQQGNLATRCNKTKPTRAAKKRVFT